MKILADLENTINSNVEFKLDLLYFNSDIFKWEPFIEKTHLIINYKTKMENGVLGKLMTFSNPEDQEFNINISIPLLKKLIFIQKVFNELE